jgi:filamentous hemagglutinin family protein
MTELPRKSSGRDRDRGVVRLIAVSVPFAISLSSMKAMAQWIVPANDGTGTQVTPEGDRFDISGGQRSGDGANLFHSFDRFGLETGQVANFLSHPDIANIFGRVVGGEASYINGLLQVSGGNSNLYLLNPAGIVFGANASLNVPADFTATTATGIGFEHQNWLEVFGENPWASLVGNPNALSFDLAHRGAIVNEGNLTVLPGSHLGLIGGVVVNTGTLQASDGGISVTAVPGESLVRLSAVGNVLSLDVSADATGMGMQPLQLPELLTGGMTQNSRLVVNADGTVNVVGSGLQIDPQTGTTIVLGRVSVSGDSGAIGETPTVQVLGDRVVLHNTTIDASGTNGGGNIFIGGDFQGNGTIPNARYTFIDAQSSIVADALQQGNGGHIIVWADETTGFFGNISARGGLNGGDGGFVEVSGKQNLIFDGTVDLSAAGGNLGTLLLDPANITISNDPSDPDTVEGLLPDILAGDFDGEEITLNAATLASQTGNILLEATNDITIADGVSLSFAPGGSIAFTADADNANGGAFFMNFDSSINTNGRSLSITGSTINTFGGSIKTTQNTSPFAAGSVSLMASGDITSGDISSGAPTPTDAGDIIIDSSNGAVTTTNATLNSSGGDISISARNDIYTGNLTTSHSTPGNIILNSSNGQVNTAAGTLDVAGATGGDVTITAQLDINTGNIAATGGSGGQIDLHSLGGSIDTSRGTVIAAGGVGGSIDLLAAENVTTANLQTSGGGPGGNITVEAIDGNIDTRLGTLNSSSSGAVGGDVTLTANRNVFFGAIDASGGTADGNINITSQTGSLGIQNLTIEEGGTDDPFMPPPSNPVTDAALFSTLTGSVYLEAHNDITVNEPIVASRLSSLTFKAGRSIFLNADIDTSGSNGDLILQANHTDLDPTRRDDGAGSILQAAGTRIDTGSGNIFLELGTQGEIGEIQLAEINTTGAVNVNSNGTVSLASENLLTLGDITLQGQGDLSVFAESDLTVAGDIRLGGSTIGNLNLESLGAINTSQGTLSIFGGTLGNVNLIADGDITTGEISTGGGSGGNIFLESRMGNIDTSANSIAVAANYAEITLTAEGDITTGSLASTGGYGGDIAVESRTGAIDTSAGTVSSQGFPSGEVRLSAEGNITTADVATRGANLTIESANGEVDTSAGEVSADRNSSTGNDLDLGDVTISAAGKITTGNVSAVGAAIRLTSDDRIDTTAGVLEIGGLRPGAIALRANDNIAVSDINLDGQSGGQAGSLTIVSQNGVIDASTGTISITGDQGAAGSATLSAAGAIRTGNISGYSFGGTGGAISLTSRGSSIATGELSTFSQQQLAGNVTLNANGGISTRSILSSGNLGGGNIGLTSTRGAITTNGGTLETFSSSRMAGSATAAAFGNVTTGNIFSRSQTGTGGTVRLTSTNGNIFAGNIETFTQSNGDGGGITLQSNTTAPSSITAGNLRTESGSGEGGDINLTAFTSITANDITTFSSLDSGNIFMQILDTQNGEIATGNITTETTEGVSGDITLNGFNIATGNLSSIGSTGSGDITIDAGGTVTTLDIATLTDEGDSGGVDVDAGGDVNTGDVTSSGGNNSGGISVNSSGGSVTTGDITSQAGTGTAGDIGVGAAGDINTGDITSTGGEGSGDISLDTATGEINTGEVTTEGNISVNGEILGEAENSGTAAGLPPNDSEERPVNRDIIRIDGNLLDARVVEEFTRSIARDSSLNPSISIARAPNNPDRSETATESNSSPIILDDDSNLTPILSTINTIIEPPIAISASEVAAIEQERNGEYSAYLGEDLSDRSVSVESARTALGEIAEQTGMQSAVVYVTLLSDRLELVVFTASGQPMRHVVSGLSRDEVLKTVNELRRTLTSPRFRQTDRYLASSQQLYQWLIAPISQELETAGIDTLLFSMDEGLRTLPIAALHDGQHFLVERYSLSLIPSLGLIDAGYRSLQNTEVLAMGASQFQELNPLPAVPIELSTITQKVWQGKAFLNNDFTRSNLMVQRQEYPYPIVHLATHGEFQPGDASQSFIQLWDEKLTLDRLRELGLNQPSVDLLVLSACRTAVGDTRAELGFAGLAVASGAKSALASLWYVSDEGTLALMTQFYYSLTNASIKADALRQAQIAMLRGEVYIDSGQLIGVGTQEVISLPPELSDLDKTDFSHPYYWSAFTLIGSPW